MVTAAQDQLYGQDFILYYCDDEICQMLNLSITKASVWTWK